MFARNRAVMFALILAAASHLSASGLAQVTLRHSAPFVGHSLELTLEGAPPGAWIDLFESAWRDETATPFGVWELERTAMARVAFGPADAQGRFTWSWDVPLATALAEAPRHYQALVRSASTTAVSQVAHLRLLGSRAYVLSAGVTDPLAPIGASLTIATLPQPRVTARIDYDAPLPTVAREAWPAFNANSSRGALLISPTELSLFDPFFGAEHARHALAPSSPRLFTSPDGETLYVFAPDEAGGGQGAHLARFDLNTSTRLADEPLPTASYRAAWIATGDSRFAYALAVDRASQQPFVERIDLASGAPTGRLDIAAPGFTHWVDSAATGRSVFVLMRSEPLIGAWQARLTRIDESGAPSVTVLPWYGYARTIAVAPQVGVFASLVGLPNMPGVSLALARPEALAGPVQSVALPYFDTALRAVPLRDGVWLHAWSSDASGHELYYRNWNGDPQYSIPLSTFPPQIVDIAAIDDVLGEVSGEPALGGRACALVREFSGSSPGSGARAKLHVFSQEWSATWELTVGPGPGSLLCVPIP